MRLSWVFVTLVTCQKFKLILSNDVHTLLKDVPKMSQNSSIGTFLSIIEARGWLLRPLYPQLAKDQALYDTNLSSEIPETPAFSPELHQIMRKNNMHVHYSLSTEDDDVPIGEVRELLMEEHGTGIVKAVYLNQPNFTNPIREVGVGVSEFNDVDVDVTNQIWGRGLRVTKDYSNCKVDPCQAYLHFKDTPSIYKSPGNNIIRVWEEFGVKGDGVGLIVNEPGRISNEPHHKFQQKITKIGGHKSSEDDEHKTNVSGVILAKHDGSGPMGISPDVTRVVDSWSNGMDAELVNVVRRGDVMVNCVSFAHVNDKELKDIAKYESYCVEEGRCDVPTFFIPEFNALFNTLHELGVTIFSSSGNTGTELDTPYWVSRYHKDLRGPQKVAVVTSWLPESNKLSNLAAAVDDAKGSQDHVRIQFANWASMVITTSTTKPGYMTDFEGSSSATPITAGVGVLVQSAALKYLGKFLSPDEVINVIYNTGQKLPEPKFADLSLTRMPDAYEAVKSIKLMSTTSASASRSTTTTTAKKATTTKKKATTTKKKATTTKKKATTTKTKETTTKKTTTKKKRR